MLAAAETLGDVWRAARTVRERTTDPLERLLNPDFREPLWEYEHSRIGPAIPGKLHGKQVDALNNPAIHRWLFWGNQVGKTSVGAVDMALSALGRHPMQLAGVEPMPPYVGWASALSWDLWEKILLPELLTWFPLDRILDAPTPHVKSMKRDILIRADNGKVSRITGKSAEQGAAQYQSARVNKVWLDEEHPEAIWDEMQPRLLRYGGRTLGTMTPLLGMTYVYHRFYEPVKLGAIPQTRHWFSHAGLKDNPAITPEARAELRAELANNPSQLAAREDGHFVRPIGAVYKFDLAEHGVDLTPQQVAKGLLTGNCYGGLDLGKWRFAFSWGYVDPAGVLTMVDEVFSQNEDADTRAKRIHDQLKSYGVRSIAIYGDCADPDGLLELTQAFERLNSPYTVLPVEMVKKSRSAGILRVESLLTRGALKVRRGMGGESLWRLGMSTSSLGRPVRGSRFVWEMSNWQYPKMPDGKVQKDDPDDATADGADMMDGLRYLSMMWLGPIVVPEKPRAPTIRQQLAREMQELDEMEQGTHDDRYGRVLRQG